MELASPSEAAPRSLIGENHLAELIETARGTPPGCFVEVGVYQGGSAWRLLQLAREQGRELYLFDTFTGIPHQDPGDVHHVGDFSDVDPEEVCRRLAGAHMTRGVFPASAIPMPEVAFAHLDCDQYRSVRDAALYLLPRMVRGGVIWIDDSPVIPAAHRAAAEVFGEARLRLSSEHGKHYVVC